MSGAGGENGEACGAWMAGTAVAGTDVDSDGAELGFPAAPNEPWRTGTCMGAEPSPI